MKRTHGHTSDGHHTKTYRAWASMLNRCSNPRCPKWQIYGGRGIRVCKRWQSFENFLADMGEAPPGKSLDRKDNDGHYTPRNCRWATPTEQAMNRSNTVKVTHDGRTQSLQEWAAEFGLKYTTLWMRLWSYGWSIDRALSTKPRPSRRIYVSHP